MGSSPRSVEKNLVGHGKAHLGVEEVMKLLLLDRALQQVESPAADVDSVDSTEAYYIHYLDNHQAGRFRRHSPHTSDWATFRNQHSAKGMRIDNSEVRVSVTSETTVADAADADSKNNLDLARD